MGLPFFFLGEIIVVWPQWPFLGGGSTCIWFVRPKLDWSPVPASHFAIRPAGSWSRMISRATPVARLGSRSILVPIAQRQEGINATKTNLRAPLAHKRTQEQQTQKSNYKYNSKYFVLMASTRSAECVACSTMQSGKEAARPTAPLLSHFISDPRSSFLTSTDYRFG